jgi:predicted ABC-class ATPase
LDEISAVIRKIDRKKYGAYRNLLGKRERIGNMCLKVIKVQRDPYAPPSLVKVTFPIDKILKKVKSFFAIPIEDWFLRVTYRELKKVSKKVGEGHSGLLTLPKPSNIIIKRSVSLLDKNLHMNIFVRVGLPSKHRRILGEEAQELLLKKLPSAVTKAISYTLENISSLRHHIYTWQLQEHLRSQLRKHGLVSFIADGSILPRRCGTCEDPLPDAIPFESPPSLRVELEGPKGEIITGLGVRKGLTIIIGSAFQGKTTILNAIASGVWNHIPGDGREKVVTLRNAFKLKTEEGRNIKCVDVSPFIVNLRDKNTKCFSTFNASGATSIAASFQELVEVGVDLILLDEDVVATNILYLDERVRKLLKRQTVIPISVLAESIIKNDISLVIASNGFLELLQKANNVILVDEYKVYDVTRFVKELYKTKMKDLNSSYTYEYRRPLNRFINKIEKINKIKVKGCELEVKYINGETERLDLSNDEQIVERTQYNAIAELLKVIEKTGKGWSLRDLSKTVEENLEQLISETSDKEIGEIRGVDLIFVINRLKGIEIKHLSTFRLPTGFGEADF